MSGKAKTILVLGGARSGKSRYAESLAREWAGRKVYLATAEPGDEEMAARIQEHQARRGEDWETVGTVLDLPGALRGAAGEDAFVLVDCLTLWLSNLMLAGQDCERAVGDLLNALTDAAGTVVIVSNEVGDGIVPENALARRFRDVAGQTNQRIAREAGEVVLVTAGLPLTLKPSRE